MLADLVSGAPAAKLLDSSDPGVSNGTGGRDVAGARGARPGGDSPLRASRQRHGAGARSQFSDEIAALTRPWM